MRPTKIFALGVLSVVATAACAPAFSQQSGAAITPGRGVADSTTDAYVPAPLLVDRNTADGVDGNRTDSGVGDSTAVAVSRPGRKNLRDLNQDLYYKNKTEFSIETGWLPNNIPFVFDFLVGSKYTTWPLHYTLVPNVASLRWQIDNPWGWKFLRGSTEFSFSGSSTAIPRGAETRYFAFDYGIRRYFVQPRWRIVPYVEGRGGVGDINAKGPHGVYYAQGQDLTFTLMVGSGARYNLTPRYAVSAGMTYMHVSNFYLSEPRYEDFGINVYGPIVGLYMRLGKPKNAPLH